MKNKTIKVFSLIFAVLMLFSTALTASAATVNTNAKVEKVEIEDMTVRYRGKQGVKVTLHTTDKNLGYKVEYFSSDESIFTVDEEGYVIAGERGIAEITVKITDDNGNIVTDTAEIEVKFSSRQWVIYLFFFGWIWY
ncbi:MAG: hypothetical protein E7536_00555 [Ruminococcaceae bacterium]|nr:hypothetical protein [Oscillospiraceae bacterium]